MNDITDAEWIKKLRSFLPDHFNHLHHLLNVHKGVAEL